MIMIEEIKNRIIKDKIQFIEITKEGVILQTENNLFKVSVKTSIFNVHPAFEGIQYYFNEPENSEFRLSCVNLEIGELDGIFDIRIFILKDTVILGLIDFTTHYKISNTLSQEKNESVIEGQLLKEREEFKNRFLANTSHELRSPLTTIVGFITILKRSDLTLSQMHYLNVIKSSSEQLKTIIDDILDISKIEMGLLNIQNTRFDFSNFFELLNDAFQEKCENKGLKFLHSRDKNIPQFVVGDKYRLQQILANILSNAIKFTNRGKVAIKANLIEHIENAVTIEFVIKDTGIGIEKDKIASIFDSFSQIESENNNTGTGLGLSIVKNLVNLMGGTITVTSIPLKNTTVKVELSFKVSENQISQAKITSQKTILKNKKYSILIAEDMEDMQLLMAKILTDYGEYYYDIASNGDQVIENLHRNSYDLILMDLKMPTMDGYDTTRFIRESEIEDFKNIPIIAVTAKVSPLEREKCLARGMNEYIGKPFQEEEFMSKIEMLLK